MKETPGSQVRPRPSGRRRAVLAAVVAIAVTAGALWIARDRGPGPGEAATFYTCGMHPEVVQDHPGECPKCGIRLHPMPAERAAAMGLVAPAEAASGSEAGDGKERKILYWKSSMIPGEIHSEPGKDSMGMDLVPVYADEVSGGGTIRIDPVTEQNMGIRTDRVVRGPLVETVRTVGFVDYDETTLTTVTTKVSGWVEKLFIDQTGIQVHAGDRLFELYSPELFSAQEEYLAALRNLQKREVPGVPGSRLDSESLVRDARTRLEYFDISDEQIAELRRIGKVRKTLTIHAPFTGIVTHKKVVEGQHVSAGQELFQIADLARVWVIAKVFEYDLPAVRLGQEALMKLSYLPGKTFRGRVTYVYPYLEAKTREVPVRMEFHNPGYQLKPGMYATVTLTSEIAKDAVLVPDVAVIRTGRRNVVFTMPAPGRFEAREVEIGARSDDNRLQVLSGLAPGETVVVSGQFLLDSESNLREAALKFLEPGKVDGANPIRAATEKAEERADHRHGETETFYVCPMPEHGAILYEQPGHCPICGMELVPVERRHGEVGQPAIDHWTCPMPEHAFIREHGPGKCPICGMSLIPVPSEASGSTPAAATPRPAASPHPAAAHDHGS